MTKCLSAGNSFSIYDFHGGTNWGFQNGANYGDSVQPITTSYDYSAPLDESGRPTEVYQGIRDTLVKYQSNVPAVPTIPDMITTPKITLQPYLSLLNGLPSPVSSQSPMTFEALGQPTGFVLYRSIIWGPVSGQLKIGDAIRDRIIVLVNGTRIGVIDSCYATPRVLTVNLKIGDVLDLFVENLGRVGFGGRIVEQKKGIVGDVYVGGTMIYPWENYRVPADQPWQANTTIAPPQVSSGSPPIWYQATFDLTTVSDTWLELPGWTKGVVYVNGVNLGRYWIVGPQQSLYLPGVYLQNTGNVISVLNLEPKGTEGPVQGVSTRTWGNNPDPDKP